MRLVREAPHDELFAEHCIDQWGYPEPKHLLLPDDVVNRFKANSCERVNVTYLVSAVSIEDVGKISPLLPKDDFHIEISTESLRGLYLVTSIPLDLVCLKGAAEARHIVVPGERSHLTMGHYLRIVFGRTGANEAELQAKREELIALIRLYLGIQAAAQELQSYVLEIASGRVVFRSDNRYIWANTKDTDLQALHVYGLGLGQENRITFDRNVYEIFNRAVSMDSAHLKYLLLWICLELHLGDGARRKRFFEEEVRSKLISERVRSLHATRGDIVHEFNDHDVKERLGELLEILRISGLGDTHLRAKLVADYENRLQGGA